MRKLVLSFCIVLCAISIQAKSEEPILMTVDNQPITKAEFEYIYHKNNAENAVDKKSLSEYLNLFINFKLKVHEAVQMGKDTMPRFLQEFQGYRNQLAKPYLTDSTTESRLYQEAYNHLKEDVDVSHVLIELKKNASPIDTLQAYNKAYEAYERIMAGEAFGKVADALSNDRSVKKNHGHLGYFTGLMTVWPFEKAMYSLKPGEVSKPIRTSYGYHVITVHGRRPAVGQIRASHIMKLSNSQMSEAEQLEAKKEINALYDSIMNGKSFEKIARLYSDDKRSASKGGDLNWFGVARMVPQFEKTAFSMNVGEISKPIQTEYGWHIIRIDAKRNVDSFAKKKKDIQRAMRYDDRSNAGKRAFIEGVKNETQFKYYSTPVDSVYTLLNNGVTPQEILDQNIAQEIICTWADQSRTVEQLVLVYIGLKSTDIYKSANEFMDSELTQYADSQLENKYPEFAYLVKEYHDGILLFDISQEKVWGKATKDVEGLNSYFKKNKKRYAWDTPHYRGFIIRCKDKTSEKAVKRILKRANPDSVFNIVSRTINTDSVKYVTIEKALWVKGENPVIDHLVFKQKDRSVDTTSEYPIVFVHGKKMKKYPLSYTDVKGKVVGDYQNYLEEAWVKELRAKYNVVINDEVLNTIDEIK